MVIDRHGSKIRYCIVSVIVQLMHFASTAPPAHSYTRIHTSKVEGYDYVFVYRDIKAKAKTQFNTKNIITHLHTYTHKYIHTYTHTYTLHTRTHT